MPLVWNGLAMDKAIEQAMWEGDVETLDDLASCICCCDEHTFESCPARVWSGCRGSGSMTQADEESWRRHYLREHGIDIFAPMRIQADD